MQAMLGFTSEARWLRHARRRANRGGDARHNGHGSKARPAPAGTCADHAADLNTLRPAQALVSGPLVRRPGMTRTLLPRFLAQSGSVMPSSRIAVEGGPPLERSVL
jgi:hypothetical protein